MGLAMYYRSVYLLAVIPLGTLVGAYDLQDWYQGQNFFSYVFVLRVSLASSPFPEIGHSLPAQIPQMAM